MAVDGAAESRRDIERVGDALRGINNESLSRIGNQVSDLDKGISSLTGTIGDLAKFAATGVSLAWFGAMIKSAADAADNLNDLSKVTGITVENLSGLQLAAQQSGTDLEGIADSIKELSVNMAGDAERFAKLGITAKEPLEAFKQLSDVFISIEEPQMRAAFGAAALGDSWAVAAPLLAEGSVKIGEMVDKGILLSATTQQMSEKADEFNDRLTELGTAVDSAKMSLAKEMLPALTEVASTISFTLQESGKLEAAWVGLGALGAFAFTDHFSSAEVKIKNLREELAEVQTDLELSKNAPYVGYVGRMLFGETTEVLEKRFADITRQIETLQRLQNAPSKPVVPAGGSAGGKDQPSIAAQIAEFLKLGEARNKAASESSRQANAYQTLTQSIQKKIAQSSMELRLGSSLTSSQQEQLALNEQLANMQGKLGPMQQMHVEMMIKELVTNLEVIESNKRAEEGLKSWGKTRADYAAASGKAIQDALSEAERNEELARTYGKTRGEIEALSLVRLEDQLAQRASTGLTLDEIETLEKLISAKQRSATALAQVDMMEFSKKAGEDLDKFLDPTKAQTFGDALKGAFGAAGDSMTQLISGLDAYGIRQAEIDKARKDAAVKYATDSKGFAEATAAISAKEVKSRMSGYGDMASAAKSFFKESSTGYVVLEGAERAFRAFELASQMESLYTHLFVTTAKATGTAAGQGVETAAVVAGEAARNTAKVPGVFMSFMSALGPWGMAAAGVAIAAVLGGAFGGGGSVNLTQQRQERQGTGTVLGSDAKSESIGRALDAIEGATLQGLGVSNDMLTSLRNIEAGIGQFASLLVRTTGVTGDFGGEFATRGSADAFGRSSVGVLATGGLIGMALDKITGGLVGKITGSVLGKIFGGKTTVEDTGFMLDSSSFASILSGGVNAFQYADIKKSGGWFSSDKYSTKTEALGEDGNRQIANVLMSLYDTVFEAGQMLDIGSDSFAAQLNSFVVDIGKVSLKGLSGDEIEKELSAVFSSVGDELAKFGVGGLEQFQKVGEGYLETLSRVATNYQAVAVVTDSLGMAFTSMGLASVGARERLVNLVGGLDEFTSSADQFLNDFYTDRERANSLRTRIAPTLDQFGIKTGAQDSLQQFRSVVTGLDLTTEAGARAYATLMQIAPAFKQIADVDAKIFEERSDLQRELDELTLSETVLLAQQRAALNESNRALFDQIQAVKAKTAADEAATAALEKAKSDASALMGNVDSAFSVLQRVVDRQKKALQDEINVRSQSIQKITALSQSLRSALDGMTAQGREAEDRQVAQAQIQAALAIARASGKLPDAADLRSALSVVGRSSADQFATQQDYLRDFYATRAGIEDLSGLTDKSLSVEERSLKSLESQIAQYDLMLEREQEQIDVLKGISLTGLSIEQALEALRGAVLAAGANPVNAAGSAINDAYKSALGRTPDKAGLDFWTDKAAGGVSTGDIIDAIKGSPEAQIRSLYREIFGRAPDAGGLQFWVGQMNGGMSLGTIREAMLGSDEKTKRIPGFAAGGDHVGGWRIVGENGPELEATGAARIFNTHQTRALMADLRAPAAASAGTDALVKEIRLLRRQVEALQSAVDSTAASTGQLADQFENVTDGGNAMRSDVVTVVRTKEAVA